MPAPFVELRKVTRRYGATVALDGASLALQPGRVHAVLGENGAGKTTLMRVAFGMVRPDEGSVLLDGTPTLLDGPGDAIAHGIGMVHQHFTLVPAMTVAENFALGGRGRFDARRVAREVAAIGAASGLHVDPDAVVSSLSVSEQQRVEILKAIGRDAKLLILDEPTAVLAPEEAAELLAWLRAFAARDRAVVLITHKLEEALSVADDVTVLRQGRVIVHGPATSFTIEALAAAMLGESILRPAPAAGRTRPGGGTLPVASLREAWAEIGRERIVDATFTIHAGEIVGVAGVEGSGHHALLRLLGGRIPPSRGSAVLPSRMGFIPEDRIRDALVADETVLTNVALKDAGRRRGSMRWTAWRERAARLVAQHDVRGARPDAPERTVVAALSGGNQQKLVLARELGDDPQLIVAENPTRGLDIRAAAAVLDALRAAAARGAAVVVHSADLDEVLSLAQRVLVTSGGRVRECACDREQVGRAMLGLA